LELRYDKKYQTHIPAWWFTDALRAEGIPPSDQVMRYSTGCYKEGMVDEHINSQVFLQIIFSEQVSKNTEILLVLPIIDSMWFVVHRKSTSNKL
jgi:hypothetical protein